MPRNGKIPRRPQKLSRSFKGASKIAGFVAAVDHGLPTKPLAELWGGPDDPIELEKRFQGPVVPSQSQSRYKSGKHEKKSTRCEKGDESLNARLGSNFMISTPAKYFYPLLAVASTLLP